MHRRHLLQGAAATLAAGGQAFAQGAPAPKAPPPPPTLPPTPEAYRILFNQAVVQHEFDTAILVVRRGGKMVASLGYKADPAGPSFIASMSKPITAVAIAALIRDGKLTFTTPMSVALAGFFKKYGQPKDPRFLNVTIEQLLVHRSGMAGNPDGDPIHKLMQERADRGQGHIEASQELMAAHIKHPLKREPGTGASYSNSGYVALGAVIEQATGKSYETFCREAVFDKLGIKGPRLNPDWRVFGACGGWYVAGEDYLRFLDVFDPAHPFLGEPVKAWIDQAQTKWEAAKGSWYSLAVGTSGSGAGRWRVSHGGGLNSHSKDARGKPIHAVIESTGTRRADGTGVFLTITPAVGGGHPGFAALLRDVERAHGVVKVG